MRLNEKNTPASFLSRLSVKFFQIPLQAFLTLAIKFSYTWKCWFIFRHFFQVSKKARNTRKKRYCENHIDCKPTQSHKLKDMKFPLVFLLRCRFNGDETQERMKVTKKTGKIIKQNKRWKENEEIWHKNKITIKLYDVLRANKFKFFVLSSFLFILPVPSWRTTHITSQSWRVPGEREKVSNVKKLFGMI